MLEYKCYHPLTVSEVEIECAGSTKDAGQEAAGACL